MNASQTGGKCGFCPGDAMMAIVKSGSSHLSKNDPSSITTCHLIHSLRVAINPLATTGEKVTRIIKDPNYRRGSEVERPEDQKRPNNGTPAPGEGEDEETRKLRTELEEVRRERAERQTANVSEAEKLKAEMRDEILSLKKEKSRTKIEKFMDKTKHIFKTRKAWEDAIEEMLTKLPYDDNDRLIQTACRTGRDLDQQGRGNDGQDKVSIFADQIRECDRFQSSASKSVIVLLQTFALH